MKNHLLKISLNNTDIWRRISIPYGFNFAKLHEVIQIIFGWKNYHLHEFNISGLLIVADKGDDTDMITEKFSYESEMNLDAILSKEKSFTYAYDFGDGWELTIEVEEIAPEGNTYPELKEFGGTMVKENCGGIYGLQEQGDDPVDAEKINWVLKKYQTKTDFKK